MSQTQKIGMWPLGIDNRSPDTTLKRDQNGRIIALRDAFNVDIDRDGHVRRRRGHALALALPGLHSLWTGTAGSFGVAAGVLYRLTGYDYAALTTLGSDDPCDYTEVNGVTVVGNRTSLIEVRGSTVRNVGVPNAPAPGVAADPLGSLRAGRYSVAIAYLRGNEEGALSPIQSVTLAEGQGIRLSLPPADPEITGVRVYRTATGGEVLYRCTDAPLGLGSFLIGSEPLGKDTPSKYMTRMMPGEFVNYWRGLLLVASGRTLYWSEPMNYGLTSLRHNFVQFARRITMVMPMDGGVFVGTAEGVIFLRGQKPSDWAQIVTSSRPPVKRCAAMMDGENIDPNIGQAGKQVAVWLTDSGFVLGTEEGGIIASQANRLRIPLASSGSLAIHDRRATAVTS